MGIKTDIALQELQKHFFAFEIQQLQATTDGIMDTTYIAIGKKASYILKKYEREIPKKIAFDTELLKHLHTKGLNVSYLLAESQPWYLYKKLKGKTPTTIHLYHLQILGRSIAKLHQQTQIFTEQSNFIDNYPLKNYLRASLKISFYYYKKLSSLTTYKQECNGFIHGDIFKDNTLFDKNSVALFDFIDGGCGSFAFELGVIEISFNPKQKKSFTKMLLRTYNQNAPKKITPQELALAVTNAAKLYGLLRISHHKNTKRSKELLNFI